MKTPTILMLTKTLLDNCLHKLTIFPLKYKDKLK